MLPGYSTPCGLTVLRQCARGLPVPAATSVRDTEDAESAEEESLERQAGECETLPVAWQQSKALERLGVAGRRIWRAGITTLTGAEPQPGSEGAARMLKYVRELETYISNNAGIHRQLRRAVSQRGTDQYGVRRVDDQSGDQQAHGEEAANAVDAQGSTLAVASAHRRAQ